MYTLGINAAYHDPAAALVKDGQVLAAAEEERFTKIKHGKRPLPFSTWELPFHAIDYCLKQASIDLSAIDHVAYSYEPGLLPGFENAPTEWTLPTPEQLAAPGPPMHSPDHHLGTRCSMVRCDMRQDSCAMVRHCICNNG